MANITAVMLDLGSVLFPQNEEASKQRFIALKASPEKVKKFYEDRTLIHAYDRGDLTTIEFREQSRAFLEVPSDVNDEAFDSAYSAEFEDVDQRNLPLTIATIDSLKKSKNYKLFLLSNMNPIEHSAIHRILMKLNCLGKFYGLFNGIYFSYVQNKRKPEPEAYLQIFVDNPDCQPEQTAFFDDLQRNVDGAIAVGIHGILFTGATTHPFISEIEGIENALQSIKQPQSAISLAQFYSPALWQGPQDQQKIVIFIQVPDELKRIYGSIRQDIQHIDGNPPLIPNEFHWSLLHVTGSFDIDKLQFIASKLQEVANANSSVLFNLVKIKIDSDNDVLIDYALNNWDSYNKLSNDIYGIPTGGNKRRLDGEPHTTDYYQVSNKDGVEKYIKQVSLDTNKKYLAVGVGLGILGKYNNLVKVLVKFDLKAAHNKVAVPLANENIPSITAKL